MYVTSCVIKGDGPDCSLLPGGRERTASSAEFPCVVGPDHYRGNACSLHWHEEFEMVLVSDGTLTASVNGRTYRLGPGTGLFVNTGVLHSYAELEGRDANLTYLLFMPSLIGGSTGSVFWRKYLDPLVSSLALSAVLLADEPWQQKILSLVGRAAAAHKEALHGYEITVRSLLSEAAMHLSDHAVPDGPVSVRQTEASKAMRQMLSFLQANYTRSVRIEEIAGSAHVSVRSCQRLFRTFTSQSPKQFLLGLRLEKARLMLEDTSLGIPEICADCGFTDQSYFTKLFRERLGATPASYRRALRDAAT
ncbi:MAG: AraC family transcriptional regulator [Clostridia bacterium]|nr:AraC family transcriptional regulator [Clostridia bacterium]